MKSVEVSDDEGERVAEGGRARLSRRYCPNCRAEARLGDRFCASCGRPLAVERDGPPRAPVPLPSARYRRAPYYGGVGDGGAKGLYSPLGAAGLVAGTVLFCLLLMVIPGLALLLMAVGVLVALVVALIHRAPPQHPPLTEGQKLGRALLVVLGVGVVLWFLVYGCLSTVSTT